MLRLDAGLGIETHPTNVVTSKTRTFPTCSDNKGECFIILKYADFREQWQETYGDLLSF